MKAICYIKAIVPQAPEKPRTERVVRQVKDETNAATVQQRATRSRPSTAGHAMWLLVQAWNTSSQASYRHKRNSTDTITLEDIINPDRAEVECSTNPILKRTVREGFLKTIWKFLWGDDDAEMKKVELQNYLSSASLCGEIPQIA